MIISKLLELGSPPSHIKQFFVSGGFCNIDHFEFISRVSVDNCGAVSWLKSQPEYKMSGSERIEEQYYIGTGERLFFKYDDLGRLQSKINSDGLEWRYYYDERGLLIREERPGRMTWGNPRILDVWVWEYDKYGRKIKEIRPSGDETEWKFSGETLVEIIQSGSVVFKYGVTNDN